MKLIGLIEGAQRVSVMESEDGVKWREKRGHGERYNKLENVDIYN